MRVPRSAVAALPLPGLAFEHQPAGLGVRTLLSKDPGLAASLSLALVLSIASTAYFWHVGSITALGDSRSRLLIARTVVEGRHAGLAQLGGIWPPFPQVYMLPLVWNDALYYTGFAGAIPSALCYLASSAFLYKLVTRLTNDRIAGVIAVMAFSGPNILYLQSVPMSELPFIVCLVATSYFTVSWMLRGSLHLLFLAGMAACLSTLTRYEGWALVALLTAVVICFCWRAGHHYDEVEAIFILFGLVAFLGIGLWLLWNRVIFGDTLYFLHSQYGTKAINSLQLAAMPATDRPQGNLLLSVSVSGWSVLDNIGLVTAGVGVLGLGKLAVARRFGPATVATAILLLFPIVFLIAAAYVGVEVIGDSHATRGGRPTNVRYGLLLAPAAGFLAGWLAQERWLRWPVLAACLASSLIVLQGGLVTVQDATTVMNAQGRTSTQAGTWLRQHYDGGLVLIQRRTNENLLFTSQVPLNHVVFEGDRSEWKSDLQNPASDVRWLVMDAGDPSQGTPADDVWLSLHSSQVLDSRYQLAYQDGPIRVYRTLST